MPIADVKHTARVVFALGLTVASLLVLIFMSLSLECGLIPDPEWVFFSFLLFFAVGFIWAASEIVRLSLLTLPAAVGVYFVVGPIGLAIARAVADNEEVRDAFAWMPFWLIGMFLATDVLPGSC